MSKIIKKTVITIMTVSMMFTSMFNTVFADATDSYIKQQPENTEGLPDYTDGFEKHGFADEDAEEIDSMFTAADWERFNEEADEALEFKPVSDTEASAVLTKVEDFLKNNGVGNYLQNGNLLQGANIGLTQNRTDKVKILGTDANAGGDYIYVIDKDATCFAIKDENGKGIANALVTISYIDDNNNRKTVSTIASDGDVPGVAVFSDLPESFNGILDVQAENYQAVSILDKYLEAGENYVFALKEAQKDSLYLRGADICGKDLLNEETDLFVVDRDTEDLTLKVLVSKTGSAGLPNTIDLYSETRGKTILTLNKMSDYEYDSNTVVYAATKRWLEQSAGLLEGGDVVSVRFNDNSHILEHLTIKKALETPRVGETTMPVTSSPMSAPITDRLGGAGWLNFSVQVLQVPVTFGVFPDGTFIIMASYDITSLDQNTQYKFNSLFDKSWKPKAFENAKNIFESFERSFWENAQKVHSGKTKLNSKDKIRMFNSRSYDISMSFSVYFKLCYNKDADDYYGNGGFVFSLGFSGGVTEYFVFFAGPVAIPLYIGFDLSFGIKIGISVNLFTETPPAGQEYDHKYKYTSNDGWDLNSRIEAIGNLNVFGGIGVKGVLGANATGYFTVDVATVLGEGPASIFTADPHSFVDLLYGMIINYYLLFFSGQLKFDCLQGAKRVYDSYGEQDLQLENLSIEFKELSLESCADELIPVNDISDTDPAYIIANNQANLTGADISNVDSYTYPDNQAQFVSTKDFTALFRIVADGEQTHLVYQYQDPSTGDIADTVFQVQLPADKSVSEYVVVPNKSDTNDTRYCNYAYIGAVLVDNTLEDMNDSLSTKKKRLKSYQDELDAGQLFADITGEITYVENGMKGKMIVHVNERGGLYENTLS